MAKRKIVPSSDEDAPAAASSGSSSRKAKKEKKKDAVKDKEKKKDKDKKDKKEKKDKDADKKDKKEKKEKAEEAKPAAAADKKDKKSDKKLKKELKGGPPTKEVTFNVREVFRAASKPFGMELDGALVVDIMDKDSAAGPAGVQIGWYVQSVDGKAVPQEDEGVAGKVLRDAEAAAAKSGKGVQVVFATEEPAHWTAALKKLRGPGPR